MIKMSRKNKRLTWYAKRTVYRRRKKQLPTQQKVQKILLIAMESLIIVLTKVLSKWKK